MFKKLALGAVAFTPSLAFCADPDVTSIVTSAGTLLSSIYPIVITAVGFGILISLAKMVKRK